VSLGVADIDDEEHGAKGMLAAVRMPAKLYAIHGSHPCRTVARAMRMKGIDYEVVELLPPTHVLVGPLVFGKRTVPGVRFESGEKLVGSVAILHRLEELVPEPALYPADRRAAVEEAERWGEQVLQPLARRLLWTALKHHPQSIPGYQEGSRLPALPAPVVRVIAPAIIRIEQRLLNKATDEIGARDARELPGHLDQVDAWLADGTLGGEAPNAADLQIATSLRLLLTLEDVAAAADSRPCDRWARGLFPDQAGSIPAGVVRVGDR
jgi:glutathione S-transferase